MVSHRDSGSLEPAPARYKGEQLRVAVVSPYDLAVPGGVQQHIRNLDAQLRAMGHKSWILGPSSSDGAAMVPSNEIYLSHTVVPVPAGGSIVRLTASPTTYPRVRAILDRHRFDVIHLHEPLAPVLPWAVLAQSKSVNIGTFHASREADDIHAGYAYFRHLFQPLFNRLDGLIAVSEAARDMVAQHLPGDYRIIPNGVDVQRFGGDHVRPLAAYDDGRANILFVGRLDKRKGFKYLLRAFAHVKSARPDARLLVVGGFRSSDAHDHVEWVRKNDVRDVHFIGRVSDDDLPRYYRSATVFCAPAIGFESFGIVLLEAMAAGVPVVASNVSGYRSLVKQGAQGLLVPPEDSSALAEALLELLEDPERRASLGAVGRASAARYDWPLVAREIVDYYEEVMANVADERARDALS